MRSHAFMPASCRARRSLLDARACRWAWSLHDAPVEAALGPIALSAVKLFTEGDFSRIKRCDGHACGWLFLDAARTIAAAGAKWRSAAIAPSRSGSPRGGAALEPAMIRALPGLLSPRACSPAVRRRWRPIRPGSAAWRCPRSWPQRRDDRHSRANARPGRPRPRRRLHRRRRPARQPERHLAACRFREPGRPRESRDLVGADPRRRAARRGAALRPRPLLARRRRRAAPPTPPRSATSATRRRCRGPPPTPCRWRVDGLPLAAIYALLAAAYSLIYGLIGRINFAFGELAAAGGYARGDDGARACGPAAGAVAGGRLRHGRRRSRSAGASRRRAASSSRCGRRAASRRWSRPSASPSSCRSFCASPRATGRAGWRPRSTSRSRWRARRDFVAVASPMTFVASGGRARRRRSRLVVVFRWTRAGREWRAYADDPLAAEMLGVSPAATTARAFALSGALAGLAGAIMTAAFGAVGYGAFGDADAEGAGGGDRRRHRLAARRVPRRARRSARVETGWSAVFPIDDRDIAVYALMILFIALRPSGLLGSRDADVRSLRQTPILTWRRRLPHPWPRSAGPHGPGGSMSQSLAAAPPHALRADALAGVRTRRILAVCLDLVLVSVLVALLWTASIVLTLGLALFFLPPLWPIVAFFYNGLTVSGAQDGDAGHARDGPRDAHARHRRSAFRSSMRRCRRCSST